MSHTDALYQSEEIDPKQKQQSKSNKAKATKQKQQTKSNKTKATNQKQQSKS